jgi:hypothetical protein
MQVTLDLPDDLYSNAQAIANRESRTLASVVLDLIRSAARKTTGPTQPLPGSNGTATSWHLPTVAGARDFTEAEVNRMLEEDGLP